MLRSPNTLLLALCISLSIALLAVSISPFQKFNRYDQPNPVTAESQHSVTGGAATNLVTQKQGDHGKSDGKWYRTFLDHTPDWFVAIFTALLAYVTYRLVRTTHDLRGSTDKLWEAGERQMELISKNAQQQSRDMQASIDVAREAADAAKAANKLAGDSFVAEQRPWIVWKLIPIVTVRKENDRLQVTVEGEIENIGRTPALDISYFGKLYSPARDVGATTPGFEFYSEHLGDSGFSLSNLLPGEKQHIRFGPHGLPVADLPNDRRFTLWLAFHAKYVSFSKRQISEVGSIYMVQPIGQNRIDLAKEDLGPATQLTLMEFHGARRIT